MSRRWKDLARTQRGLTLVELLVALTISLVIMAGVGQIFAGNRESYRLQAGMGRLHENARFAIDFLRRDLSMGGYSGITPGAVDVPLDMPNLANGAGSASDTLAIQYQANQDCLGQAAPGGIAINRYYIDDPDGDGVSSLMCLGNGSVNPQALVDGVDNMQVLYGEDLDGDNSVDQFVSLPTGTGESVVSIRLALLLNTIDSVSRTQDTQTYNVLNAAPLNAFNDLLRRRLYVTTINLRNV